MVPDQRAEGHRARPRVAHRSDWRDGRGWSRGWVTVRWPLPAEAVEFSVSHAAEKSMPFVRSKSENRPFGLPAVADADAAIDQVRHLDAVAVGETQRTLNPVSARTRPIGRISERRPSHVTTSLASWIPLYIHKLRNVAISLLHSVVI
jgi:hypothetical protein